MSTARVDFTRGAAERIARVVRIVEQGERSEAGPIYGLARDDTPAAKIFRLGTFAGPWDKGASETITFLNVTSTPNTVTAMNLFANVSNTASSAHCAIARYGTAWYLIAAECD